MVGRIEIRVIRVQGNKIRLGIGAPLEMSIRRGERTPPSAEAIDAITSVPVPAQ